ncbi:MAG TPA: lipid II flippase MurJ, partial [Pyrinomonadaceae bacterium]|nr:lipid II flippase MurJ [Pyrinomonadaceae bacterium]
MNRKPDADDAGEHDEPQSPASQTNGGDSKQNSPDDERDAVIGLEVEEAAGNKDAGVAAGEAEVPDGEGVQSATTRDEGVPVKDELTATTTARPSATPSAPEKPHSVARSAGIVSIAVMGSRVLGLVREQVFANYFGSGFIYDAFQVGFRIPNTLRDLFAEGALSVAFVKTFTDYIETKSEEEAWRLASMVLNALAIVLSVITIVGIIFAPQIVGLIAPGFSPEKAALATMLTRIMFPFLLLVALAA